MTKSDKTGRGQEGSYSMGPSALPRPHCPTWAMGVSPALTLLEDNGAASGLDGGLPEAKGWL